MDTASLRPPDAPILPLTAGDLCAGRFELQHLLGRGGMGEVWAARDLTLGREVALKVFSNPSLGARALERIRREVAVARDLVHPHLVRYYDIHPDGARWALSMESVKGTTLQEELGRSGPLPEGRVREVLFALAGALGHLHAHGAIHRDVKPSNIFLAEDGTVKLGDFGIVHVESEEGLTLTGETMGTPTHMAPEQFRGEEPSPASDWYALGIVLYEMLAGRTPFTGTYGTIAAGHMDRPAPALPRASVPRPLRRLAEGLLLKDPRRRWDGGAVLRYCSGRPLPFLPRHRRFAAAAVGVLILTAVGWTAGRRLIHPPLTAIQVRGDTVAAFAGERLLWERREKGMTSALLSDTDGDGSREVVIGRLLDAGARKDGIRLDVLNKDGTAGTPLFLGNRLGSFFNAFRPEYNTMLLSVAPGRFAIIFNHRMFYPTYGTVWDASTRGPVFSLAQSGHFYSAIPFGQGVALEGINNRLLHQRVLLVTQGLGRGSPAGFTAVDDVNQVFSRGVRAYHLLGGEANLRLEGPDSATLRISGEPPRKLRPDATFEGMAPGSAGRSVEFLEEYRQIRDVLIQGGAAAEGGRLDRLIKEAGKLGQTGYAVLFASLKAEALLRLGKSDAAIEVAIRAAEAHPSHAMDLRIQAGLYALLEGDARKASGILQSVSDANYGGRREEVRTILVWAAMLNSPRAGRAMMDLQSAFVPEGLYWEHYFKMQEGWIRLLDRDLPGSIAALAPALGQEGMENHAAGYFLASILNRSFDSAAFDAFMADAAVRPEYLLWTGAFGKKDAPEAARHWALLEQDAFHTPDSALMLALMRRVRDRAGRGR